jgi:hypothetical protein
MGSWQALTGGPRMIVIGEVLLVVCSLCYLVWWAITFKPWARNPSGGGLFLAGAVLGGLGGLVLLVVGIAALLPKASSAAQGRRSSAECWSVRCCSTSPPVSRTAESPPSSR